MPRLPLIPILFMLPLTVSAEVMDKETSALFLWLWVFVAPIPALLAARYRPWLLLLVLPVPVLFFTGQLLEVTDPQVGPAILSEAGLLYVVGSWVGPVLLVACVLAGFLWRRRSRSAPNNSFKPKPLRGSA